MIDKVEDKHLVEDKFHKLVDNLDKHLACLVVVDRLEDILDKHLAFLVVVEQLEDNLDKLLAFLVVVVVDLELLMGIE